ncbi:origin recognition complex subunit 4 C-terminus-domain-containing protein [Mucidula mucida]|nr:origin recognition complex subunit 4 C-terminus-domain-containing protein [Mucidula mucida]
MPPRRSTKSKTLRKPPGKITLSPKRKTARLETPRLRYYRDDADDGELPNDLAVAQLTDLLHGTIERGEGIAITEHYHNPIIVRLSGWIQHNDRLAMREIAAQLREQTGTTFLLMRRTIPPVSTHLPMLISLIPTLSRPTVIILDAFDLFSLHARQALLYCLLDTAQSCRAGGNTRGLSIIGLTSRMDTINLLEKRVKSRFSGRVLRTSHFASDTTWINRTKMLLCPEIPEAEALHPSMRHWKPLWQSHVDGFLADNGTIETIRETFGLAKDYRTWNRILTSMILHLTPNTPWPAASMLQIPATIHRSRTRMPSLNQMTYSSLCLLTAAMHSYSAGFPLVTFEMLNDYFQNQVRSSAAAPVQVNGGGIGMSFEALVAAKVFVPVGPPGWNISKEFVKFRCVLSREDIRKAVEKSGHSTLNKWLKKS